MSRVGDTKLEYGITDELWGLVQTVNVEESAEKTEARRGNNSIAAVEYSNAGVKAVRGTYIFRAQTESGSPSANVGNGTAITLQATGDSIYIHRASREQEFNGWRMVSFEGDYFPNLGS